MEAVIEGTFVRLLGGVKGKIAECGEVQRVVFGDERRAVEGGGEVGKGVDDEIFSDESGDEDGGGVPLPHQPPSPNSSNAKDTTPLSPQAQGLKVAKEREKVRQAARRGVAFGFRVGCDDREGVEAGPGGEEYEGGGRRKRRVEAVQNGRVVEASFAKGEWGIRWKE